jgi:RNA polymerase subunit RPABC4/transcription elongation factor Spt4
MPIPKKCIDCDAVIGDTDTICPACGVDQEEVEMTVKAVERANRIIAKRTPKPEPQPEPIKSNPLASLLGKKKK